MFQWLRDLFSVEKRTVESVKEDAPRVSSVDALKQVDLHAGPKYSDTFVVTDDKLSVWKGLENGVGKLTVPEDTLVYVGSGIEQKCRAERARVETLYVHNMFGKMGDVGFSQYDDSFTYEEGDIVEPRTSYSVEDEECSSGIHFFTDFDSAWMWSDVDSEKLYWYVMEEEIND